MPAYESLILSEKTAVIFDIGSVYTKCGFAGETSPRFILPTVITLPTGEKQQYLSLSDTKDKRKFFIQFFHNLYYRRLLVNPKDRRVVIVESFLSSSDVRSLIADVLYKHFEIPSALFAPAHLFALHTLGITTAIVLDCGYRDANVIPVCDSFTLLNAWQSSQLGSQSAFRNLKGLIMENADLVDNSGNTMSAKCHPEYLTEHVLEDLSVRACFISPAARAADWKRWLEGQGKADTDRNVSAPEYAEASFTYPLGHVGDNNSLRIPSRLRELAFECLFSGEVDEDITLATLILNTILCSPIDARKLLAQNIVLTGGTVNIPGFANRLIEELNTWLDVDAFSKLSALKGTFRIHEPPANANYVSWLGGAIFGALECLPGKSLERTAYMNSGSLPDWTTTIDSDFNREIRSEVTR